MYRTAVKPKLPPSPTKQQSCRHKWVHLDTKKRQKAWNTNTIFTRIDNFYCENCCEIKTIIKEDCIKEEPDWY